MKTRELIEYLSRFDPETDTAFLVLNPPARIIFQLEAVVALTDGDKPVIGLEIGDGEPFDDAMVKAAEEDEANESVPPMG